MLKACDKIRDKVRDVEKKGRGATSTVLQKSFPGGMLTLVGSNSASDLSSQPVRYVIGDELDRFAISARQRRGSLGIGKTPVRIPFTTESALPFLLPQSKGRLKLNSSIRRARANGGRRAALGAENIMRCALMIPVQGQTATDSRERIVVC